MRLLSALAFAFCKDDATKRYHTFAAHGLPDHGESILANFVIRTDVVRAIEIPFIDLIARDETIYIDRVTALDGNGVEFLVLDHDVFVLRILVAASFVGTLYYLTRRVIHSLLAQSITGFFIDLTEGYSISR